MAEELRFELTSQFTLEKLTFSELEHKSGRKGRRSLFPAPTVSLLKITPLPTSPPSSGSKHKSLLMCLEPMERKAAVTAFLDGSLLKFFHYLLCNNLQ